MRSRRPERTTATSYVSGPAATPAQRDAACGTSAIYLAAIEAKLAQLDERTRRATTIHLGMPALPDIAGDVRRRSATSPSGETAMRRRMPAAASSPTR
ncbi:hypothetical protein [Nonomuraea sp. NPDC049400]|uniref:hypothetical protein n=1 Tax=Nonomuraea sp. NPDC049400 TaxID=3364352 RepID=UPI0037AC4FB6